MFNHEVQDQIIQRTLEQAVQKNFVARVVRPGLEADWDLMEHNQLSKNVRGWPGPSSTRP